MVGCRGAHRVDGGWAPCESAENLRVLLRYGVRSYRKRKAAPKRIIVAPQRGKPTRAGFERLTTRRRSAAAINAGLLSGKAVQKRNMFTGAARDANIPRGRPEGWPVGKKRRRVVHTD